MAWVTGWISSSSVVTVLNGAAVPSALVQAGLQVFSGGISVGEICLSQGPVWQALHVSERISTEMGCQLDFKMIMFKSPWNKGTIPLTSTVAPISF